MANNTSYRRTCYNYRDDIDYSRTMGPNPYAVPQVPKKESTKLNPKKYEILDSEEIGRYLVVKIKYSGIQDYASTKILVYDSLELETLTEQGIIDPHFSENKKYRTPFACFEPTLAGWHLALKLCNILRSEQVQYMC